MTDIDPYPVSALFARYNRSRDVIYKRLDALNITPHRLEKGNQSYISLEELRQLDELHEHVVAGGKLSDFPMPISTDIGQSDIVGRQLSELGVEQFLELAHTIAGLIRPDDRFSNYEQLERFARNGWLIQSKDLRDLIGRKRLDSTWMRWGGFEFTRSGRWWRIKKI